MSSFIAVFDGNEAIIGTDTLFYSVIQTNYRFFGSKTIYVPHMGIVMASSGAGGFMEHYWTFLNLQASYRGIEEVARHSQKDLADGWQQWKTDNPWPEGREMEQAIWLFGISECTGEMLAFQHYSWNGFRAEDLSYRSCGESRILCKPFCAVPDIAQQASSFQEMPAVFFQMMNQQRANQASNAYGSNDGGLVTIGGELQIHHLNRGGCAIYKAGRFDDYDHVAASLWGNPPVAA